MSQTATIGAEIRRTLLMAEDRDDALGRLIDLLSLLRDHPELGLTVSLEMEDVPADVLADISGFEVRAMASAYRDRKTVRVHHDRQNGDVVDAVFWGESKL